MFQNSYQLSRVSQQCWNQEWCWLDLAKLHPNLYLEKLSYNTLLTASWKKLWFPWRWVYQSNTGTKKEKKNNPTTKWKIEHKLHLNDIWDNKARDWIPSGTLVVIKITFIAWPSRMNFVCVFLLFIHWVKLTLTIKTWLRCQV